VLAIKAAHTPTDHHGADGWALYRVPSTGPARYVELRHYLLTGSIARWAIEPDGRVSAHNDQGRDRKLIATGRGRRALGTLPHDPYAPDEPEWEGPARRGGGRQ